MAGFIPLLSLGIPTTPALAILLGTLMINGLTPGPMLFLPQSLLGYNRDQIAMSQEDNTCDLTKFIEDFGWTPQPFEPTLREYAGKLA